MSKVKERYMLGTLLNADHVPRQPFLGILVMFAIILDFIRSILSFLLKLIAILLISGMVFCGIIYLKVKPEYDSYMAEASVIVDESTPDTFRYNEVTVIYDKNKNVMERLSKDSSTIYLPYEDIPKDAVNALIAAENRSFWDDPGIDWKGIGRVIYDVVRTKGSEVHGASTITQQLSRNVFLNNGVTLDRKLKEMAIAVKLTEKYSKEQIMEFYVNDIYFANGYYGLEAAANGYFGKSADELSLSQTAYLCAIPNSPTFFDPYNDEERALSRRDIILDAMYDVGFISRERLEEAKSEEIQIKHGSDKKGDYGTTYAMDCAVRYFMKLDGFAFQYHFNTDEEKRSYDVKYQEEYEKMRTELLSGGYRVYTSLDTKLQDELMEMAGEIIGQYRTEELSDLQASLVLLDDDGLVTALVGGIEKPELFGFNRAYQAYRQPGSTIKPLIDYAPALMMGISPEAAFPNISVSEALAKEKERMQNGTPYSISDLTGTEYKMGTALEKSLNGVAYVLMDKVGVGNALPFLEKMHFTNIVPEDYTMSAALGGLTYGVTPVEMAGAYSCLANGGEYLEPTCIVSILDRHGNEIYQREGKTRIYDSLAVKNLKAMMGNVMKTGTGAALGWYERTDVPVYCKTGTTNEQKDAWMCGWAEKEGKAYTMSVWIGCDMPKTGENADLWGSTAAGSLFRDAMLHVLGEDRK